ncbi:MAG: hypothetical protein KF799_05860 [Bdellovibrionales bacterium]|nr:hypothetical protein [Bdellovibrionales bacterium]
MNGKFLLKVLGLVFVAMALINCSKSGDSNQNSSTPAGSCAAGQLWTGVGCLPSCGTGMVFYNNQCISAAQLGQGTATQCGTGKLMSQYGCLLQCGTNAVWYNNQCVQVTGGQTQWPFPGQQPSYPPTGGQGDICSGRCGAGAVETYSGCMPQYTCGACYGYNNGWCHKGVNAEAYYGM